MCLLVNLQPDTVEEAQALIPSLKVRRGRGRARRTPATRGPQAGRPGGAREGLFRLACSGLHPCPAPARQHLPSRGPPHALPTTRPTPVAQRNDLDRATLEECLEELQQYATYQ